MVRWSGVILVGVAAGTAAWVLLTLVAHVWEDHSRLHQIWDLEVRRAQAVQQALPAAPSAPAPQ